MMIIEDFEKREFNYGCGVVTQNFLLNYSLLKISLNPGKKVEFSSEKQKDMSDDGNWLFYSIGPSINFDRSKLTAVDFDLRSTIPLTQYHHPNPIPPDPPKSLLPWNCHKYQK